MVYETTRSILFYLNTRARSAGSIGSPQFTFPNNLVNLQPQNGELIRLTMQEASIEYTFYQTETFNNKFYVEERAEVGGVIESDDRIVEFEIGNYNLATFIVELTQKLNLNSQYYIYQVAFVPQVNGLRYIVTPKSGVTIPSTPPAIIFNFNREDVFQKSGVDIVESANEIMGFLDDTIIELSVQPNDTLECQSNVPISVSGGVQNLYVTIANSCDNLGNTRIANDFTTSNILGKIPVSGPPFSVLYFYDINSNFATIIQNKYLDNLSLQLVNERFTLIEPRKNWSLTCRIEVIRMRAENYTQSLLEELVDITKLKMARKEKNTKINEEKNQILDYTEQWLNPTLRNLDNDSDQDSKESKKSSAKQEKSQESSSTRQTPPQEES